MRKAKQGAMGLCMLCRLDETKVHSYTGQANREARRAKHARMIRETARHRMRKGRGSVRREGGDDGGNENRECDIWNWLTCTAMSRGKATRSEARQRRVERRWKERLWVHRG